MLIQVWSILSICYIACNTVITIFLSVNIYGKNRKLVKRTGREIGFKFTYRKKREDIIN